MQGLGKQCGRHEEDGNFTFTTSPSYSLDPDGKAHSWLWTLTSGPQGAQVPGGVFRGGCDLLEPHGARDLSLVAATSLAAVLFLRGSESGSGESGPTPSCHPSGQGQHEETTSHVPCLWTHRVMMAQAAPLLLLLPLLLMGSQGQVLRKKYQEGQTLRVSCDYNPQRDEKRWKTWCKVREDGKACDRLITRTSALTWQRWDSRISLEDDTYSDQKGSPPKYSQTTAEMHTTNLVTPVTISSDPGTIWAHCDQRLNLHSSGCSAGQGGATLSFLKIKKTGNEMNSLQCTSQSGTWSCHPELGPGHGQYGDIHTGTEDPATIPMLIPCPDP
uniref:Uncharacterized protein LOC110217194 isoform X5 n=1 Tax=Phascolarctos cinereus TaxID=38626 RepID=A0A6P5LEE7_PHACI|nr:uncharacterized protein LOC110217194 isoform X5 [Phascolarctos cinereus]